jgi:hypothetical protein
VHLLHGRLPDVDGEHLQKGQEEQGRLFEADEGGDVGKEMYPARLCQPRVGGRAEGAQQPAGMQFG